jgi:hypothetical protein
VTRAKKSLHILEPKNYDRAYIIWKNLKQID